MGKALADDLFAFIPVVQRIAGAVEVIGVEPCPTDGIRLGKGDLRIADRGPVGKAVPPEAEVADAADDKTGPRKQGRELFMAARKITPVPIYPADPDTGTVGNALVSDTWYDASGNTIKLQEAGSGTFTKTIFDGLGRARAIYMGYDIDETNYTDAATLTGDIIVEQSEVDHDAIGNSHLVTSYQRHHDDTITTGALTTSIGRRNVSVPRTTSSPGVAVSSCWGDDFTFSSTTQAPPCG